MTVITSSLVGERFDARRDPRPRARRVLVTGADGFVGGHIARALRASGHTVTGVVFARPAKKGEVRVDFREPAALAALPKGIEDVVHAAGIVDGRAPAQQVFAVNVGGTRNLLRWARARRVGHFVQVSSVAVYGPLALGEERSEETTRLGLALGLPYMRSKAQAERLVESSGIPYTLLRPPAVVGPGDTVITPGFVRALRGSGLPLLPRSLSRRQVSVAFVDGLTHLTQLVLARGPLLRPLHAVDAELTLEELATFYAEALGKPLRFSALGWPEALRERGDAGYSWLVASARFGQHYSSRRLREEIGYVSPCEAREVVRAAVAALP